MAKRECRDRDNAKSESGHVPPWSVPKCLSCEVRASVAHRTLCGERCGGSWLRWLYGIFDMSGGWTVRCAYLASIGEHNLMLLYN